MKTLKSESVYQRGEEKFRVLVSDKTVTYYIPMNHNPKQSVQNSSTAELLADLKEGIVIELADSYRDISNLEELTQNQKEKAGKYFKVLDRLWRDPETREAFLIKSKRKEIIDALTGELGLSESGARKLITSFFRGGMTYNSVVPKYNRRSGLQKQGKKKGRKRKNETMGIPITQKERDLFLKYFNKEHLKNHKSLRTSFNELLKNEYTREVILPDGKVERISLPESEKPTYRQFNYWVYNREDKARDTEDFVGTREYNNNVRMDRASTLSRSYGPGRVYEMDATHLNVTVVSEFNRSQPIGRPMLYSVVDTFSRMVTGFLVTLKNESWETSAATLVNVARDKVEFCADYGVEIEAQDWPCTTLPQNLVIDNGGAKTAWLENLFKAYGVCYDSTAPYSPRHKPNVERKHSDYKQLIRQFLPGADPKNQGGRGVKDARTEAILTLSELTRILIEMTLYFNHHPIKDYPLTLEMEQDGIRPVPAELWQWGYKNGLGVYKEVSDINQLRYILLPRVKRRVGQKGIRFNNNYYVASDELSYRFLNNHLKKNIELAYDPNNINFIYIADKNTFYPLKIKNRLSESEVISSYDIESRITPEADPGKFSRENMMAEISRITRESRRKNDASNSERRRNLKNLKEKRKEEINRTQVSVKPVTVQAEVLDSRQDDVKKTAYDIQREKFLAQKRAERNEE